MHEKTSASPARSLRIIHVLHSHGYGGAENHVLLLMQGLMEQGHEVMFAGPLDSWLGAACKERGIEARHLRMSGLYDLPSHWRLRAIVRDWQPDIVHGHLIRGAWYAGWAAPRHGRPAALATAHATTAHKHMGRCARIIAVSQAVKDNLVAHGRAADTVNVVYNGVPDRPEPSAHERAALREELQIPTDAFAVVNAGRFIRDKGQDLLVGAMGQIDARVHLYLMGDVHTPFGAEVLARGFDPARVHFLGYRKDVQRLLPAFDAYALSSRREALPLSLAEAFAARLPVVATRVGGVPEIVLDGQTGLLVPPDDVAALGSAIHRLLTDGPLATRVAAAARQRFAAELTTGHMVAGTLAVYRQLSADKRA